MTYQEEVLRMFQEYNAAWIHNGNPQNPHAELTSGKCSNAFFDCLRVLCHPNLNEMLAKALVEKLRDRGVREVDWVIGSPYAAIAFSYEVAKMLGAVHGFAEKVLSSNGEKEMAWPRLEIPGGAKVLQVEELITTSKTFRAVCAAVRRDNPNPVEFLPVVGTIIHRPPELPADYSGVEVVSLAELEVWAVDPKDCPLCAKGSERLRPKTHWAEKKKKKKNKTTGKFSQWFFYFSPILS